MSQATKTASLDLFQPAAPPAPGEGRLKLQALAAATAPRVNYELRPLSAFGVALSSALKA
jgi:hypothetical protein